MIQSAFANPKNFKPSLFDYAKLVKVSTKQAATQVVQVATSSIGLYLAIAVGLSLVALVRGKK